ncbi:hypothetical protein LPJ66_000802 [Kickxella alabastrina]|uniref:Uncharacterized protein n=1 Tax=Kickxella alabastrina TaxID=61397 RepID=A0ACC1IV19_9FUNG|nr:hypothetical protein LPJ66_000802 [Kickxella alabastrina]
MEASSAATMAGYGSTGYTHNNALQGNDGCADDSNEGPGEMEVTNDLNPVGAYFETTTIRRLLLEHVSLVLAPGQIHTPDVQLNLVTPLWQSARQQCGVWRRSSMRHRGKVSDHTSEKDTEPNGGPLASAAMLYAALANRDYFLILAGAGQSQADLHESRAEVAEALAILCAKALHKLGGSSLANALCAKFTPLDVDELKASGCQNLVRGEKHMSLLSPEQRVRVYRLGKAGSVAAGSESPIAKVGDDAAREYLTGSSRILAERAIEVAIRSEAKRFTAIKPVAEIVQLLWDGTLHWKGFQCVALPASPPNSNVEDMSSSRTHSTANSALLSRGFGLDIAPSVFESWPTWAVALEKWLAKTLEPLRIPMVENTLTMIHAFFFLTLYTIVSLRRQSALNIEEIILHVCALAYIADEIRQCKENGLVVYFKSVWNILDVTIYVVFVAFFCLRMHSLYTGNPDDLDKAFDVLALNASMLWPRMFAVLDQFEFCGTIIIQVRRIISGTSLFFALLIVMTAGFFQTFFALSQRHNELDAKSIWGLMARIFFGSALLGWDQADLFGPYVGHLMMSMYIGVSMLILYNILIGVINQCMVEITQNSAQEFRFAYTMRVVEYVSAKQTYPCVPPLNVLQVVVFWPLRKTTTLSHRPFALFRSMILITAYAPHLVLYKAYKVIGRWWRAKSGMHHKALRAECHLAEKELAWIKIDKDEIDEFAFSGSTESTSSGDDDDSHPMNNSPGGQPLNMRNMSSVITMQNDTAEQMRRATRANLWTSLMQVWKQKRRQSSSSQHAGWTSAVQPDHSAGGCDLHTQTYERIALMEARMTSVDKKLNNITRLLQTVINDV